MKDIQPINVFSCCHLKFFEAVANNDLQFICANSSLQAVLSVPCWMEDRRLLILTLTVNSYYNHKLVLFGEKGWDNKLYALVGVHQKFETMMNINFFQTSSTT